MTQPPKEKSLVVAALEDAQSAYIGLGWDNMKPSIDKAIRIAEMYEEAVRLLSLAAGEIRHTTELRLRIFTHLRAIDEATHD